MFFNNDIKRGLITVFLLLSVLVCAVAQSGRMFPVTGNSEDVAHSTMLGIGKANVMDSYLSPYNYTGPELRLLRETMRMTKLLDGKVSNQTLVDVNASYLENRTKTAEEWAVGIRYSIGWHYHFPTIGRFRVLCGLMASGYLGGVYNTRNGNNPAQAKADITIDASAMAFYGFSVGGKEVQMRYQVNVPLVGVAFSPNYGQSYYEIFSLGHYDHNVVFAHVGNMPSMRHLLTADIPVGKHTLRVGYSGQFNQSTFNNLRYHSYTHDFMLGFVKYFSRK